MNSGHRKNELELLLWSAVLASCVLLYTVWPQLDLAISRLVFAPNQGFVAAESTVIGWIHHAVPIAGWLLFLSGTAVALGFPLRRSLRMRIVGAALAISMLAGVAGVVNGILKSHWGRARPVHVAEFGGAAQYTPPLVITRQCERNCSFVSGHASTGFALMALGVYGKRRQRRRWLAIGWAAGLSLGVIRIAQGGHFMGDVLFAGLLMWGLCLAMRPILLGTFRFFSAERIVWRRV